MSFLERFFEQKHDKLLGELSGFTSPRVLQAMKNVPRRNFVHPIHTFRAYKDTVLSIPSISWRGEKATISQPKVVAFMTGLLDPQLNEDVLEIGTASGYQAAILGKLARRVVTVEIIPNLVSQARKKIRKLGVNNVEVVLADGSIPFTRKGVFDKMLVTASVFPHYMPYFLSALKENGICVLPIGGIGGKKNECEVVRIRKTGDSYEIQKRFSGFGFVLMEGRAGWENLQRAYLVFLHERFFS